jgi:hypothetical protein
VDGNEIIFRFRAINDNASNLFIDNIFIYDAVSPASIKPIYNQTFNVYPNPADEFVEISFDALKSEGAVWLFDITGKEVLHKVVDEKQTLTRIQTSNLNAGIYLIALDSDFGRSVKKLVIR